jgi:DNA invertase Pin-like site-specific DNA recombinase
MALIGYARVSTDAQSLGLQIDALKAAGCERIFTEKASGAKANRAELARALDYMRQGDTLVVWKLDRLARSMAQLVLTIEHLEGIGIGLRCLTQPIDTTTASGRLVLGIFSALAEFERELIKERTMEGLAAARARGNKGGRPPVMTAEAWATVRAMLAGGASVTAAAKAAGVSRTALYQAVRRAGGTGPVLQEHSPLRGVDRAGNSTKICR